METERRRIGISGGTFDPIHNGHLIVAQYIMEILKLEKVVFVPSGKPPHKTEFDVTPAEMRYEMVCEAVKGNPLFGVSRIEIERSGNTYTIDTLKEFREIYGPETDFYFITGADVIRQITTWKDFTEVFKLCDFVAAFRPNYDKNSFLSEIERLKSEYNAKILTTDVPLIDISSTEIRERVHDKRPIRYLVPERVDDYIMRNWLYT